LTAASCFAGDVLHAGDSCVRVLLIAASASLASSTVALARSQPSERAARERRARSAAEELTKGRIRVGFDRSIYVPEDEICFFVFDAPSRPEAALAGQRAELDPIRVVEAVSSRKEDL
jgi:hypothetical protein